MEDLNLWEKPINLWKITTIILFCIIIYLGYFREQPIKDFNKEDLVIHAFGWFDENVMNPTKLKELGTIGDKLVLIELRDNTTISDIKGAYLRYKDSSQARDYLTKILTEICLG